MLEAGETYVDPSSRCSISGPSVVCRFKREKGEHEVSPFAAQVSADCVPSEPFVQSSIFLVKHECLFFGSFSSNDADTVVFRFASICSNHR